MKPAPGHDRVLLPRVAESVTIFAVTMLLSWRIYTADMEHYLLPWFAHIVDAGPVQAFAVPFSNYTPPYLYLLALVSPLASVLSPESLIKMLSIAGTAGLFFAVRRLLEAMDVRHPSRGAALVFVLPSVALNAGIFHQCDAMWSAAAVMALAAAIGRRHVAMFAWCGLAIAFKAQAMFVAPFFLAYALAGRVPFWLWLATPLAFALAMLPAALAGWPVWDLATIYLRQADTLTGLSQGAPNIWAIVTAAGYGGTRPLEWFAVAITVAAIIGYVARFSAGLRDATPFALIVAAALSILLAAGLLPRMHERYFFLADILGLVIMLARPVCWRIALCVQAGSTLALVGYLSTMPIFTVLGAVAMLAATWLVAQLARYPARAPDTRNAPRIATATSAHPAPMAQPPITSLGQ